MVAEEIEVRREAAVMFLSSVNKKENLKGRIRETSTIGSHKEKNKIAIPEEYVKAKKVDEVHTRIVLEDGHFYLENVSSNFGTYVGLPKKKYFEINGGDQLLLGGAKCQIESIPVAFYPLDGIIDKIMGTPAVNIYDMKIVGHASIEKRLDAALKKFERDDD